MTASDLGARIETVHEMDADGEFGEVIGYHLDGHIDLARTDEIMAVIEAEHEYDDAPVGGWDLSHVWVRNDPALDDEGKEIDGTYVYVYRDAEFPGSRPVTLVAQNTTWRWRCVNHPEEIASTGRHRSQVLGEAEIVQADPEAWEQVCDETYVYQCRPCSTDFDVRMRAARIEALAAAKEKVGTTA